MLPEWVIVIIVLVGLFIVYLIAAAIVLFLMKAAKKKAFSMLNQIIPIEQKRFDLINKTVNELKNDGVFPPKNLIETLKDAEKDYQLAPLDISIIKGKNDFLIMYLHKYLSEKKYFKQDKYLSLDKELESNLFLDPNDRNSPYYQYNKKAAYYNAYLNMMVLSIFGVRRRNPTAPIL